MIMVSINGNIFARVVALVKEVPVSVAVSWRKSNKGKSNKLSSVFLRHDKIYV